MVKHDKQHVQGTLWFFLSSRRRHTRLQGDWSSDVCSSDLYPQEGNPFTVEEATVQWSGHREFGLAFTKMRPSVQRQIADMCRSEERRVGDVGRIRTAQ